MHLATVHKKYHGKNLLEQLEDPPKLPSSVNPRMSETIKSRSLGIPIHSPQSLGLDLLKPQTRLIQNISGR